MKIKNAKYKTSAVDYSGLILSDVPQIAFAGRSNVGKSSFINFITNISKLCRTSSQPGRTRMINYFEINNGDFLFVDLPGYGYAKASQEERGKWARFMSQYFENTQSIANIFVLVDLRHPPQKLDIELVNMLNAYNIPFTVIGTKADKVKRAQLSSQINIVSQGLGVGADNIYPTSSLQKKGLDEILIRIEQILENYSNNSLALQEE